MIEKQILSYLKKNRPQKFYSFELEESFGISGGAIRNAVNTLRKNGEPICSDRTGYWYSESPKEIKSTIENLNNRKSAINNAIDGLETAYFKVTPKIALRYKIEKRRKP